MYCNYFTKSTVDSVRLPMLENFQICYPSLNNQKEIVNFLDKQTDKIDSIIVKRSYKVIIIFFIHL